ncbi:hypothetical protein CBS101457_001912 [Exobasidium rhododendri]|nr:hypothetical protein CBS101457_001912 [Exobasidium rhododendri]
MTHPITHAQVPVQKDAVSHDQPSRVFSQEDHQTEEDGDDVFSNPDTAELESSRSDATGATSPTPHSPGPSSPSNRGTSHIAIVTSQYADPLGTLKQSEYSNFTPIKQQVPSQAILGNLPSADIAQHPFQRDQDTVIETPKIDTSPQVTVRPQFGRTLSGSGLSTNEGQSSLLSNNSTSRVTTPRKGGHLSSQSASHLNLSQIHNHPLPSAHEMPSDPQEASTLSKLFAHPPAQSPVDELSSYGLGVVSPGNTTAHGLSGSSTPILPNMPNTPLTSSNLFSSRLRSRPTTRPPSPDRFSSPSRGGVNTGLGIGSLLHGGTEGGFSEESIFERDIEHRDAGHLLSKQEAVDVAIPSVLDDAVEAITCDDADHVEIVTPHPAPSPLALSAQALSALSINQSQQQSPNISHTNPPTHSPSPPLSISGGVNAAPPGSMAAQIAESLAFKSGQAGVEDSTSMANSPLPPSTSRHRRPHSDASVSSSTSLRSRSPQLPLSIGVQQVLDANHSSSAQVASASRSLSTSPAGNGLSKSTSLATTPRSGSVSHANLASMLSQASSPKVNASLPLATAFPSLPLPNPFRGHSPNTLTTSLPDGGMPMLSSVSMDGAVMTTSDSATMSASLDGLADVIASSQSSSNLKSLGSTSPTSRMRGLDLEDEVGPYSSRGSAVSSTLPRHITEEEDHSMPGSFSLGLLDITPNEDTLSSIHTVKHATSSSSTVTPKKRLSFFSYADIINHTPAEVVDFDTALRQGEGSMSTSSSIGQSLGAGPNGPS